MNTVNKQAAIEWLKDRKAKNAKMRDELAAKGDYMHAALAQDNVSEINAVLIAFESGRFDSPSDDRLRAALDQIEEKLTDDTSLRAQQINRIIQDALSTTTEPTGAERVQEPITCAACLGEPYHNSHTYKTGCADADLKIPGINIPKEDTNE